MQDVWLNRNTRGHERVRFVRNAEQRRAISDALDRQFNVRGQGPSPSVEAPRCSGEDLPYGVGRPCLRQSLKIKKLDESLCPGRSELDTFDGSKFAVLAKLRPQDSLIYCREGEGLFHQVHRRLPTPPGAPQA